MTGSALTKTSADSVSPVDSSAPVNVPSADGRPRTLAQVRTFTPSAARARSTPLQSTVVQLVLGMYPSGGRPLPEAEARPEPGRAHLGARELVLQLREGLEDRAPYAGRRARLQQVGHKRPLHALQSSLKNAETIRRANDALSRRDIGRARKSAG